MCGRVHLGDVSAAAMHGNATGLQGLLAANIALLELAGGGGAFDEKGIVKITVEHVKVANLLVDINIGIREQFRAPLECLFEDTQRTQHRKLESHFPVGGGYEARFAAPLSTQMPAPAPDAPLREREEDDREMADLAEGHEPVAGVSVEGFVMAAAGDEEDMHAQPVVAVRYRDMANETDFMTRGLGANGEFLFPLTEGQRLLKDRECIQRILLSGKASMSVAKLTDSYTVSVPVAGGTKRKKHRPSRAEIQAVVTLKTLFGKKADANYYHYHRHTYAQLIICETAMLRCCCCRRRCCCLRDLIIA